MLRILPKDRHGSLRLGNQLALRQVKKLGQVCPIRDETTQQITLSMVHKRAFVRIWLLQGDSNVKMERAACTKESTSSGLACGLATYLCSLKKIEGIGDIPP